MSLFPTFFRNRFRMFVACLLIVLGVSGMVHAVRASIAEHLYLKTKYGLFTGYAFGVPKLERGPEVFSRAYRASELYAANYYFPAYAAKCALYDALSAQHSEDFRSNLARAHYFARQAVGINPYEAEGRMVYALTLAEDGKIAEAIAYWRDQIVEREFWNTDNHNFLARLYLRSSSVDDMELAVAEIPFIGDNDLRIKLQKLKKTLGM